MINTTKIAKSNLKVNKSRCILIIITILLSTALLSAVGMTLNNWNEYNKERVEKYYGTQHGAYGKIDEEKLKEIRAHADIEEVGVVNGVGVKTYEDETKIGLAYMDDNSIKFNSKDLIDGKFPTKKDEIVLDDLALEKLGYEKKLGQKIKLDYEDYTKDGITSFEFTLCGITKSTDLSKNKKAYSGIVSKEYMQSTRDMDKEVSNIFITIKNADNMSGEELKIKVKDIGESLEIPKGNIMENEDYINSLKPDMQVIMWGIVIAIIVILSSILVIYNIFYLSIVTKVQEFGKLRAIGATKKQIKAIVLKEGIFLATIAIPLGILVGYIIAEFILGKIFIQASDVNQIPIMIGVIIISFITVFLSLLKPMKVASKVSIVDAVRYNGDETKSKTRKGYESIDIKGLCYANLKRNKKRTYITIISLSLSGIIFIVMASVMNSIDPEKMARQHFPYDIQIHLDGYTFGEEDSPNTEFNMLQTKNPLGKDFREQLLKIDGVKSIESRKSLKLDIKNLNVDYDYDSLTEIKEGELEDLTFYLEEGEIDMEKLKTGEEILITNADMANDLGWKPGDKIDLTFYDGDKKVSKEFKIQAITSGIGSFQIHNDVFEKIAKVDATDEIGIYVDKDKYDEVKAYFENLDDKNDYIISNYIDENIVSYEFSLAMTKAIAYSLVIIVGIIGFINLINSMITSIITRKKELGMLQAIGLTDKQLIKMLNIEALFYTVTMLVSSLVVGGTLGYIAVYVFRKTGGSYAVYTFPIVQIILMAVVVVAAQLLLTYLISKNFNKESLIDRVRYSE